jgi:SNF2 family DNA or RNA helicase
VSAQPSPRRPDPRPYQVEGREFLIDRGRALLADEPGLGKSRQLIEAAQGRTLVVAPAMVLDGGTWVDEIDKWADGPATWRTAPYTRLNQRAKTGNGSGSKPVQKIRPEYDEQFDTVILDECHYIKGRKTSWTWAVQEICKRAGQVYLATGTPIPNWAQEMFTMLCVMFPDEAAPKRRLGSYWRWAETWFDCSPTRYSKGMPVVGELLKCDDECLDRPRTDPCDHYLDFAKANLGDRFLRRLRDDVLTDLPPLVTQQVLCPLTKEQRKVYNDLKKEYLASIDGAELVAWTPAARNVLLDRVTTGIAVAAPEQRQGQDPRAGSSKLERLSYDLEGRARPTLVVAHYRDSVEAAAEVARLVGARVAHIHGATSRQDRETRVRAFQAGKLDVLVGSLETISEGLTLTAADMLIFLEQSYKPSRNEQAMRRIHRLGQTRPCTVLDYVAPGTVDANKRELLATKTDRQMRTLTAAQFAALL